MQSIVQEAKSRSVIRNSQLAACQEAATQSAQTQLSSVFDTILSSVRATSGAVVSQTGTRTNVAGAPEVNGDTPEVNGAAPEVDGDAPEPNGDAPEVSGGAADTTRATTVCDGVYDTEVVGPRRSLLHLPPIPDRFGFGNTELYE